MGASSIEEHPMAREDLILLAVLVAAALMAFADLARIDADLETASAARTERVASGFPID
jgi:hypothetical protein